MINNKFIIQNTYNTNNNMNKNSRCLIITVINLIKFKMKILIESTLISSYF